MLGVIIAAAVVSTLLSHLGLLVAIGKVCAKILSCTKCATFWISVIYCQYFECLSFVRTICIATAACYLSIWLEMFYYWLTVKYNDLWEQLKQQLKS